MQTPLVRPVEAGSLVGGEGIARPPAVPTILSNVPGSFAWHVFRDRHPKLIAQIREAYPYLPG